MQSSLNLQSLDQEQTLHLTKFFIKNNHNVFLFGNSGIGKTELSIQAIKECGYKPTYINLSVIERNDLAGYPNLHSQEETVSFKSPHFLPKLASNIKPDSVLLFDEIDKVSPEITAPLLEILLYRKINGQPINAASCILTGNLPHNNNLSQQINNALLDRGAKFLLQFNFNNWLTWATENQLNDLILGFLRYNPNFISSDQLSESYALPSPRSWTLASKALAEAKKVKIVDIQSVSQIVSGYVGHEAGLRFKLWYEHYRQFESHIYSLIESGEMKLNFKELLPSEKVVFVISACYYSKQKLIANKDKLICLERLCQFFKKYQVDNELQVLGLHNSFSFDMVKEYKLYTCKPFFALFSKLAAQVNFRK